MTQSTESLVIARVIGDVVDMFVPSVTMSVYFQSKRVNNGCDLKPSLTSDRPHVTIDGHSHILYTLVMIDPDAPNPCDPSMREWVHWIVTDIPGGTSLTSGKERLSYDAPNPTVGCHRYILVLYEQKQQLGSVEIPKSRRKFNTRQFAEKLQLGLPVAIFYFNAQREQKKKEIE